MELLTINQALNRLENRALASGQDIDAAALRRLDELALTATPRSPAEARAQFAHLEGMARGGSLGPAGVDAFMRAARALAT